MDTGEFNSRSEPLPRGSRWTAWLVASLTILAAALRLHDLAAKTFWHDEGFSAEVARLDFSGFAHLLWAREANMALYYVLLRAWMQFGGSESWVRGLSVVFGVAMIPLLYPLGAALASRRAGLVAVSLGAVNACCVAYSQQARGYSLAMLLVCLSMLFLVKHVQSGGQRYGMLWAVASALAVYSHFYAGLVVGAECASLAFLRPAEFSVRQWFRAFRAFVYMVVPAIAFLLFHGAGALGWLQRPAAWYVLLFFTRFSGNDGLSLLAACAVGCALAAWAAWRVWRERGRSVALWRYAALWLWLLFPICACLVVSVWRPVFLVRYLLVSLPALILLVAVGLEQLRRSVLIVAAVLVIGGMSLQGVRSYYQRDFDLYRDDWRDATHALLEDAQPGDAALIYVSTGRMSYEYYRSLDGASAGPLVLYPAHAPGRLDYRDFLVEPLAESLEGVHLDAPRVWLVLDLTETPSGVDRTSVLLRNWCEASHPRVLEDRKVPGIELLLLGK
jgi:mannosyltransferase